MHQHVCATLQHAAIVLGTSVISQQQTTMHATRGQSRHHAGTCKATNKLLHAQRCKAIATPGAQAASTHNSQTPVTLHTPSAGGSSQSHSRTVASGPVLTVQWQQLCPQLEPPSTAVAASSRSIVSSHRWVATPGMCPPWCTRTACHGLCTLNACHAWGFRPAPTQAPTRRAAAAAPVCVFGKHCSVSKQPRARVAMYKQRSTPLVSTTLGAPRSHTAASRGDGESKLGLQCRPAVEQPQHLLCWQRAHD